MLRKKWKNKKVSTTEEVDGAVTTTCKGGD